MWASSEDRSKLIDVRERLIGASSQDRGCLHRPPDAAAQSLLYTGLESRVPTCGYSAHDRWWNPLRRSSVTFYVTEHVLLCWGSESVTLDERTFVPLSKSGEKMTLR